MYFIVVIDSFGIGADDRASEYGDSCSYTAMSASSGVKGRRWDFLERLGLGNACAISKGIVPPSCPPAINPLASYGAMRKRGDGKDTQTGHWEIAGMDVHIELKMMPQEYPSFGKEIMDELTALTGREFLGNCAASGTVIIQELGDEHIRTGKPIIYTSADSVMQIAAHTDCIPLDELYDICIKARKVCDKYGIGRVIARPFTGPCKGQYTRTLDRRDFSIQLPATSYLNNEFVKAGIKTVGVGKIGDIFNEEGLFLSFHDKGNDACLKRMTDIVTRGKEYSTVPENSVIFINLVDTDTLYGHRRDPEGYGKEIDRLSKYLEGFTGLMKEGDVLYITADHGCDPSFRGTDHTREFVPMLVFEKGLQGKPGIHKSGENLGIIEGFDFAVKDILRRETI